MRQIIKLLLVSTLSFRPQELVINAMQVTHIVHMQLLVIQFIIKISFDYKLPEDDTVVPKHVGM
jgi:hypothetical protein